MAKTRGEYSKSAERRTQILDAAFVTFAKDGYNAASVNQIARIVGITQTGVLHHFSGGKPSLLRAVLERRDGRAKFTLGDRTGREFLAGLVEISRSQESARGAVHFFSVLSAEAAEPDHPANRYFTDRYRSIVDAITHAYEHVGAENGLRAGVDPRKAALLTVAMTEGLERLWLSGFDIDMAEDIRGVINQLLCRPI